MDGAQVGVFEETDHVGFGGLLEGEDCRGLEAEVVLEFRSDLTDESLERQFADQEFGGLLETTDFAESDCAGSESVGLLNTTGVGGLLLSLLVGDVLSGLFATGVLASSLLCASHFISSIDYCVFSYLNEASKNSEF